MSEKSELYNTLKEAGAPFEKKYVQYTVDELKELGQQMLSGEVGSSLTPAHPQPAPEPAQIPRVRTPQATPVPQPIQPPERPRAVQPGLRVLTPKERLAALEQVIMENARNGMLHEGKDFVWGDQEIPVKDKPEDRAGLSYSVPDGQPLRIDLQGRIWFRDEILKPAVPKPRMTRKKRYMETGVKKEETFLPDGRLDEIYEVAGETRKELTVTTTLPSWQVGKYKDPRFPFAIHVYNGIRGFDHLEIVIYFGGLNLVPKSIRTIYVGNQLCYDITSARETIQDQFNALRRN